MLRGAVCKITAYMNATGATDSEKLRIHPVPPLTTQEKHLSVLIIANET